MTTLDIIQTWLKEGRAAWLVSQGMHPFALMDNRANDLALKILEHVTESQASPASEGGLDTQSSTDRQDRTVLETILSAKETQAVSIEGPSLKEVSSVLSALSAQPVGK